MPCTGQWQSLHYERKFSHYGGATVLITTCQHVSGLDSTLKGAKMKSRPRILRDAGRLLSMMLILLFITATPVVQISTGSIAGKDLDPVGSPQASATVTLTGAAPPKDG